MTVAAQDVAAINFIAASRPLKEALKSANLLKSLPLNTFIMGQPGTGRHTLAAFMMPDAPTVRGDDQLLEQAIQSYDKLIVEDFDKVSNLQKLIQLLKKNGTKVIAIADKMSNFEQTRVSFGVHIELPPLEERPEDIEPLANKFFDEAATLFGKTPTENFKIDMDCLDLSMNAFSLRKSVFLHYLSAKIDEQELMSLMETYLLRQVKDHGDLYRQNLSLYEVPLIRAGVKRYKSQLKMSQAFGLNRNTLRKKINEWKDYL